MELQWPLILFTTFIAWSAGLLATQGICALRNESNASQMKALFASAALLAIGGVAVFFHLEHWERIFNGFGHLSSGITQEFIAVVIVAIVMVTIFAYLRRSSNDPHLPTWLSVLAIIAAVALLFSCGHSYMMAARPAWNSIFELVSLFGGACILGPASFAIISAREEMGSTVGTTMIVGSVVNIVSSAAYLATMSMASYTEFDATYFDPTAPAQPMIDVSSLNAFSGDALFASTLVIAGALAACIASLMAKKQPDKHIVWAAVSLVTALVSVVALRIVFYQLGVSVFAFY
ncbi:MAG: hypothetical protein Q4D92_02385 [Slackia sp.]|nr:hypothetical protein [Slackia sp.]